MLIDVVEPTLNLPKSGRLGVQSNSCVSDFDASLCPVGADETHRKTTGHVSDLTDFPEFRGRVRWAV